MRSRLLFRAFAYRNYRLFWGGQAISLIGSWMQRVAMGWLVYRLTQSPLMLGIVEFSGQMPAFLFAPFAGYYLDYWNRRKILIFTQFFLLLQALCLGILVLSHHINVPLLIILNILFGLINAFDMPARQAFLKDIIENREDIGNAIALNSSMFNAARMIGPSVAGFVIAWVGEGYCFLINAVTFSAVLLAIAAMKMTIHKVARPRGRIFHGMGEGFRYAFHSLTIRVILIVLTVVSLVGLPYTVFLPALVKDVFQGDARMLGWLTSSAGIGALYGAYYLASRKSVMGLEKILLFSISVAALSFMMIALFKLFWLSLFFIIFVGFAIGNTILQTIVEDRMRGRVMSLYTMTFLGMAPIGSLIAGSLAKHLGVATTLFLSGILLLFSGMLYSTSMKKLRRSLHRFLSTSATPTIADENILHHK